MSPITQSCPWVWTSSALVGVSPRATADIGTSWRIPKAEALAIAEILSIPTLQRQIVVVDVTDC